MFHSWNKNLLVFYTLQYKEIIFIHIHCTISDYIIVEILCRIHIPRGLKVGWSHTLAREVRKSHIALPSVGQKHLYTGNALLQQAFSSLPLRHAAGYAMWNRWVEVNIEWYSTLKLTIPQRYNSGERDSWKELLYVCNAKKKKKNMQGTNTAVWVNSFYFTLLCSQAFLHCFQDHTSKVQI